MSGERFGLFLNLGIAVTAAHPGVKWKMVQRCSQDCFSLALWPWLQAGIIIPSNIHYVEKPLCCLPFYLMHFTGSASGNKNPFSNHQTQFTLYTQKFWDIALFHVMLGARLTLAHGCRSWMKSLRCLNKATFPAKINISPVHSQLLFSPFVTISHIVWAILWHFCVQDRFKK